MATRVYNEEDIVLQDGTEATIRPLPLGRLRRFMEAWATFKDVKSDDDGFNVFIACAGIALEHEYKGKFDALKATAAEKKKGEFLSPEYKEHLEDILDLDTIYRVLEVSGNLQLTDPKALTEAAEAMETAAESLGNP